MKTASLLILAVHAVFGNEFDLTILHTNDVHSRYDEINAKGDYCQPTKEKCYGGLARLKTKVDEYRRKSPNTLLFDAGDQFQGSMLYTYYRGNATLRAMNHLQYNASTLGNHEFDNGPLNTGRVVKDYTFPVLSCNIEIPNEYKELKDKVVKSTVFEEYNLGVIGYIFPLAQQEANLGNIKTEDPIVAVQQEINALRAKGIRRFIAVSHNGYQDDVNLAKSVSGLSLIVGGHTHSYLGPEGNTYMEKTSEGDYPTKVINKDGKTTYVVQAHQWTYLLGHIAINFSSDGYINDIQGEPIKLDSSVAMDPATVDLVKTMRRESDNYMSEVIGHATQAFRKDDCKHSECALGSLFADVMLHFYPQADFAMLNTGSIRKSFDKGPLNNGNVFSSLPYENSIVLIQQTGQQILNLLQRAIAYRNGDGEERMAIQVAGLRFIYAKTPEQSALGRVETLGSGPRGYQPLDPSKTYTIATLSFLANGGSNLIIPKIEGFEVLKPLEDLVVEYIKANESISPPPQNRMIRVEDITPKETPVENAATISE